MLATPSYGLGRSSLMCLFFHLLRCPPLPLEELLDNELLELLDVKLLDKLLELDEPLELLELLESDDKPLFFFLCFRDFFDFFFGFLDFFNFFVNCAGTWLPIPVLWALDVMKLDDATNVTCLTCLPDIGVGRVICFDCLTNTRVGGMTIGVEGRFRGLGLSLSFPLLFLTSSSSFHLFANEVLIDPAIPCGVRSLLMYVNCTSLIGQSLTGLVRDDTFILDNFSIVSLCLSSMTCVFFVSFFVLSSSPIVSLATLTWVFLLLPFFFW